MKRIGPHTFNMSREEAVDLILTGIYVRRVGVSPADRNVYLTIKHLYDQESSVLRNIWTGEEIIELWDHIEFA
jgi:hypothetical protein